MRRILYTLTQCTWGFPQTFIGLMVFLFHIKDDHFIYHGSIVTKWNHRSSVSLGLFVFVAKDVLFVKNKQRLNNDESFSRLLVHEYGHTIQSLILGPLYIFIIGVPSACWAAFGVQKRRTKRLPYGSFWTEGWANNLGEYVTTEKSIEDIVF